jgi:ligand-binding sensor domain-containing protein
MRIIGTIVLLCSVFFCENTFGQSISYKKYGIKDGLPGNNVFRVYQDKQGYIWISCDYGLSRFDGYTFKNYSYEQLNGTSLSIDEDGDDLWVGAPYIYQYVINKKGFAEYIPVAGNILPTVIKMQIDDNGRRWLLSTGHSIQYIYKDTVHSLFIKSQTEERLNVYDIYYSKATGLLIATDRGVYVANKDKTLSIYNVSIPQTPFFSITDDQFGNMYFGQEGSIYVITNHRVRNISISNNKKVIKMAAYDPDKIWFLCAEPDVYGIDNGKESSIGKSLGLKNVFFNDIFCDKTGLLFLASNGEGLYTLYNTNTRYYNGQNGLSGNSVFSLCDTKHGLFIGSRGNINIYNDNKISELPLPVKIDEKINAMLNVGEDLWIATPFNIYKYNLNTHKYITFFPGAICLGQDEHGDILAGGYDRVYNINRNITKACTLERYFPMMYDKRIHTLFYDAGYGYWFGAGRGITLFRNNDTTIFGDTITKGTRIVTFDIEKDTKGNLWFATSRGIFTYNKKGKWQAYRVENGLPNNVGLSLMADKDKMLVGTAKGLASFDGNGFTQYTPENGFPINEITTILVKDSTIFLGTNEGLYICKNTNDKPRIPLPTIQFTSVRYGDSNITLRDTIAVSYSNRPILLDFTAIEYRRQDYIVYEYRIKEGNWYEIKNGRISFTSLSPGTYNIDVRTKHKITSEVSGSRSIVIVVHPPFWQRWWFVILCILSIILTGSVLISWRIKRIKQKEKIRLQRYTRLLQLKQQATNALMSPHFIFNALNSIQHFINQSDALSANRFLSKFAKMIRTTMENSARLNIKLKEEIELLELYLSLEAIRLNGKLSYQIRVDETLDKEQVLLPSILIQPYVENAVWHGIVPKESPGKIIVEIKRQDSSFLSISIQDDGVGIEFPANPKERNHKSLALKLNEDRLKMIEKMTGKKVSFSIEALHDGEGRKTGTLIQIQLPINLA